MIDSYNSPHPTVCKMTTFKEEATLQGALCLSPVALKDGYFGGRGGTFSRGSYSQGVHFGGGDFEEFTVFCWSLPVLAQSSQDELCG